MSRGDSLFTDHVRHFGTPADRTEEVLAKLERLLRQRMRRRGLLSAPPAYLGYIGPNWDVDGAFDDVRIDCYCFAFADRLVGLRNKLRTSQNIDGVIVLNVGHFLTDRQKRHDPIGYATFGNVVAAVSQVVLAGEGQVENLHDDRLHNDSVLRFVADQAASSTCPDSLRDLLDDAPGWSEALPKLVVCSKKGQQWLHSLLRRFAAAGVGAVLIGDLVTLIGGRAREEWRARHALSPNEFAFEGAEALGQFVRLVFPDSGAEGRDRWEWIKDKLATRIRQLPVQERVRVRLARIFQEFAETIDQRGSDAVSQADLCRGLDLPRSTMSDDFRRLCGLVDEMLAKPGGTSDPLVKEVEDGRGPFPVVPSQGAIDER